MSALGSSRAQVLKLPIFIVLVIIIIVGLLASPSIETPVWLVAEHDKPLGSSRAQVLKPVQERYKLLQVQLGSSRAQVLKRDGFIKPFNTMDVGLLASPSIETLHQKENRQYDPVGLLASPSIETSALTRNEALPPMLGSSRAQVLKR